MSTLTLASAQTLTTVAARDLEPGDLIGGTAGQWLAVARTPLVYRGAYKNTEANVTVHPVGDPGGAREWLIDADVAIAVIRDGGAS